MYMCVYRLCIYSSTCQGWGRLQRHDYDYTMIIETDYDYNYKT